jgi:sodium/hydrogen exchanger-like protein 6/7/sodium/hydrogen exchanger 8
MIQLGLIREYGNFSEPVIFSVALLIKYSATICASDSVAALTMIKPDKYPKLFSIVFGEGMINDAVAIILFKVVGNIFDHYQGENVAVLLLQIVGEFLLNVLCSFGIGLGCGNSA